MERFFFSRPLSAEERIQASLMLLKLRSIHISIHEADEVWWTPAPNGKYLAAHATQMAQELLPGNNAFWVSQIWNKAIPSKVSCFLWLALQGKIPVLEVLRNKHVISSDEDISCIWCQRQPETIHHLLLHCGWTHRIWRKLFSWWHLVWALPFSLEQFAQDWFEGMDFKTRKFWALIGPCAIWEIWKARNEAIFNGKILCWDKVATSVVLKSFQWSVAVGLCQTHQYYIWVSQPWVL